MRPDIYILPENFNVETQRVMVRKWSPMSKYVEEYAISLNCIVFHSRSKKPVDNILFDLMIYLILLN